MATLETARIGAAWIRAAANTQLTKPNFGGIAFPTVSRLITNQIVLFNLSSMTAINEVAADNANHFSLTEQTTAGYLSGVYNSSNYLFDGVRYDNTTNSISNLQRGSNNICQPVSTASKYNKLLPSALAVYDFTPDLIGHLAYRETLDRSDTSVYALIAKVGQPANGTIAVTLANPDIKPRETTNYDASLDVYFDHHRSLISVQYFHKD